MSPMAMVAELFKFSNALARELAKPVTPLSIRETHDNVHTEGQKLHFPSAPEHTAEALRTEVLVYLHRIFDKPLPNNPSLEETNIAFWNLYKLTSLHTVYSILRLGGFGIKSCLEPPVHFGDRHYSPYEDDRNGSMFHVFHVDANAALKQQSIPATTFPEPALTKRLRMNKHRTAVITEEDDSLEDDYGFNMSYRRGFLQMKLQEYRDDDRNLYPTKIGAQTLSLRKGQGAQEVVIQALGIETVTDALREQAALQMAKCILHEQWNSERAVVLALEPKP